MQERSRILAVEDDRDLLELTSAILGRSNDVACECTTAPALRRIAGQHFDLLVTDLNIEGAGDGLILAEAMRYLQPQARTVLITGYPDFTRAVLAMQGALDVVLVKPVDIGVLRDLPRKMAEISCREQHQPERMSLWLLLEHQRTEILAAWLKLVEADKELAQVPLTPAERLDHMDFIVTDIAGGGAGPQAGDLGDGHAAAHGHMRHVQNYSAEWVAKEIGFLRRTIFDVVLRELLQLDLSALTTQIFEMNNALDVDLLRSLRAFGLLQN